MPDIILASSSHYRRLILDKLGLTYTSRAPNVDETPHSGEEPEDMVKHLALAKAQALTNEFPKALIIGSDQVAVLDGKILGKPGTHENAFKQLSQASGKAVRFLTGLCLLNSESGDVQIEAVPFSVHFRQLTHMQIEHYLQREQPYDCAGSFKSEGFGIALFEKLEGDDPNTLIGLPLIRLIRMLEKEGVKVL